MCYYYIIKQNKLFFGNLFAKNFIKFCVFHQKTKTAKFKK